MVIDYLISVSVSRFWDDFSLPFEIPALQKQHTEILLNQCCLKLNFRGHSWAGELCHCHFQFSSLIESLSDFSSCPVIMLSLIKFLPDKDKFSMSGKVSY